MTNKHNPLSSHFRAPKIFAPIPSAGKFYNDEVVEMPETQELPIFAMTAKDEMIMKNPDANILRKYNLKEYNYDIVIARMEPENNIEMILESYVKSNKERKIVVVGSLNTPFGKYISKKYQDEKIIFVGFVSGIEKLDSLRYFSNLYFHGHSVGGTNPSLLEAMASNSLICAHDNVFNKSILEKDAFYFNDAEKISRLINEEVKSLENYLVKSNVEKIKNLYSWNKIVNDYELFFQRISNK